MSTDTPQQSVDKWTFTATVLCILGVAAPLLLAPQVSAQIVEQVYDYLTTNLGLLHED